MLLVGHLGHRLLCTGLTRVQVDGIAGVLEELSSMGKQSTGDLSATAKGTDKAASGAHPAIPVSIGAMLVTLGVVYGDIGTSPMYVTKALVAGNGGIMSVNQEFVLGALSLVIWTVTLLTTVKYVLISLKADNHGEGGIFALYSIVRRFGKWLIIPAMLGGSALLADGILTPAVTVTTAIEGLRTIPEVYQVIGDNQMNVVAITLAIICLLFVVQRAGTSKIGRAFGPVMTLWFIFLGVMGLMHVVDNPIVFLAINPLYGIQFLLSPNNYAGFMILGSCFLATTGAEALYSDMGHVGRGNIYATWPFVKICLLFSYLGQGAWLLSNAGNSELLAIEAVRQAANGLTAAELAAWAEEARYYIHGYFTLESFDALARGGRIPPAAATVGGKLDIKPELSYDTNGALTLRGMCRGRKKALRAIIADFKANYLGAEGGDEKLPVAIVSADAEKDARWLADQVRREPGCEDVPVIYSSVGPVIGAHVGPGMVALLFWGKDRRESLSFTDRIARKVRGQ